MKKSDLNYFIDIGLGIFFFISFVTGILKFKEVLLFFTGFNIYFSNYWLNFIHDRVGILMGIFVFIHLILHLNGLKR